MTRSKLPVLIVGAGLMGRHHARAAAASNAAIACIVDRDLEAARWLARKCGAASAQANLQEALNSSIATVAHVCTPATSHGVIAKALAQAGLHALIEKPLGVDSADVRQIHRFFNEVPGGKLVCPTHQYAFQQSLEKTMALLPRLGRVVRIGLDVCSAGASHGNLGGDELVAEVLPHLLAIIQRLQPAISLREIDWKVIRSAEGEWSVAALSDGGVLTMSVSAAGRPTRFMTSITGEYGSAHIDHFHDFSLLLPGRVSKAQKILAPFSRSSREFIAASSNLCSRTLRREFAYPGLQSLVAAFYKAIRTSSPPPITQEQSIDVADARDAILSLASRG